MGEYYGYEDSFITGLGFRKKGQRPKAVLESENFSKSLLDLGEEEYDEWGRKKKKGRELTGINVEEVSYVNFPATKKKFYIVKGSESDMEDIAKKMSEDEIKVLQKTISILAKHKVTGDLEKARAILQKNFGKGGYPYPYPVKKAIPAWPTAEKAIFGFNQQDLDDLDIEEVEELSKSNDGKWPSLTRQFDLNKERISDYFDDVELEERFV